jgi:NTE family protein
VNQLRKSILQIALALALCWGYCIPALHGQKVAVVLSGGGATALAHVGFIKVLEQNNIPIDYIGGTSMGAVVASLYATGYSASEIESYVRSERFIKMATGIIGEEYRFFFKNDSRDASMANIKLAKGGLISSVLPSSLIDPILLDWELMEGSYQADAVSGGYFDSLFVPFRCLAADVEKKQQIVFRQGPLNVAVRASSTYPFYLPPLKIDGSLLYDGGLYNNFPADVMYQEFSPDVIIGCNVSGAVGAPDENDMFTQLRSMILFRAELAKICPEMIVVEPNVQHVGTFDYQLLDEAIKGGYTATMDSLPAILDLVPALADPIALMAKRNAFRARFIQAPVGEVEIVGLERGQKAYVHKFLGRRDKEVYLPDIKSIYVRLFDDDKIKSVFPTTTYIADKGKYKLTLDIRRDNKVSLAFGGNYSSRSINTGFIGVRYNVFGNTALSLHGNSYFGRYYGSAMAGLRWDVPGTTPLALHASIYLNRWDFYKSLATFFEDVKPSYVLLNERYAEFSLSTPAGNKGIFRADFIYTHQFDAYYQTQAFLSTDTTDRSEFNAGVIRLAWERSTLNKKQFANKGTMIKFSLKYTNGQEITWGGNTNVNRDTLRKEHRWLGAKFTYTNYFTHLARLHLGFHLESVVTNQNFFTNYIASSIMAPTYNPLPESSTFFMPEFRAHNYLAGGAMAVLSLNKNLDLRAEAHVFNAFGRIVESNDHQPTYNYNLKQRYQFSGAMVYHSPLGPISISTNYFDKKEEPYSFLFCFGYVIYNRSARD